VLGAAERIDSFPENPGIIAERRRRAWRNDRFGLFGCAFVAFVIVSLLVSGVTFWWHLITGTPLR